MGDTDEVAAQHEIDRALAALRGGPENLPKGLDPGTLDLVLGALRSATGGSGLSAAEVGELIGASRVTARRYLEHLADAGRVARRSRYGAPGRPEVEYRPS
jgi:response regulator of citrate/malate metabolism